MTNLGRDMHINRPAIDYCTLTSWEFELMKDVVKLCELQQDLGVFQKPKDAKVQQYVGLKWRARNGNVFVGEGEQDGMLHYRLEVSGSLAEDMKEYLYTWHSEGAKCTRIDIQATIEYPLVHSQFKLFSACYARNELNPGLYPKAGWHDSIDPEVGQTATVYIGSRSSLRFMRIYDKRVDIKGVGAIKMLRAEVQFKKEMANSIMMTRHRQTMGESLAGAIQMTKSDHLSNIYREVLEGFTPWLPKSITPISKTAKWLMGTVANTMQRVINDHNEPYASDVAQLFYDILSKSNTWDKVEK